MKLQQHRRWRKAVANSPASRANSPSKIEMLIRPFRGEQPCRNGSRPRPTCFRNSADLQPAGMPTQRHERLLYARAWLLWVRLTAASAFEKSSASSGERTSANRSSSTSLLKRRKRRTPDASKRSFRSTQASLNIGKMPGRSPRYRSPGGVRDFVQGQWRDRSCTLVRQRLSKVSLEIQAPACEPRLPASAESSTATIAEMSTPPTAAISSIAETSVDFRIRAGSKFPEENLSSFTFTLPPTSIQWSLGTSGLRSRCQRDDAVPCLRLNEGRVQCCRAVRQDRPGPDPHSKSESPFRYPSIPAASLPRRCNVAQTARTCIYGHLEEHHANYPAVSRLQVDDNVPGREHALGRPRHAMSALAL